MRYRLRTYRTVEGKEPFNIWREKFKDLRLKSRILNRLMLFQSGNFGDHKSVGDRVLESRLHFGPGYRIYFSAIGKKRILLLCGGDKGSQKRDIGKAKIFLKDYQERGGRDE